MYYFGTNLENRFSVPDFWPRQEQSHKIPLERGDIERELARMNRVKEQQQEQQSRASQTGADKSQG